MTRLGGPVPHRFGALLLALAFGLGALGSVGSQAGAESFGVSPPEVSVAAAQRNETYHRSVTVQNEYDTPTTITYLPGGEVATWLAFTPPSGFEVPARTHQDVTIAIAVPSDTPDGVHRGHVLLEGSEKEDPSGTGATIRPGAVVNVTVTVGGQAVVSLRWVSMAAQDVEVRSPAHVTARVANEGNVRATATARVEVTALGGTHVMAAANGSVEVSPGEQKDLRFPLGATLPIGQYAAHVEAVEPAGFADNATFKVLPPDNLGKDAALRALLHGPRAAVGLPVRIDGAFDNVGNRTIYVAQLTVEVHHAGRLVAALESPSLLVAPGAQANLTVHYTPQDVGVHRAIGLVTYDGFQTATVESILNVHQPTDRTGPSPYWWLLFLLPGVLFVILLFLAGQRRGPRRLHGQPPPQ